MFSSPIPHVITCDCGAGFYLYGSYMTHKGYCLAEQEQRAHREAMELLEQCDGVLLAVLDECDSHCCKKDNVRKLRSAILDHVTQHGEQR